MTVPLVIDTDIGSDVDDAIALALAVRHPGLDLRGVTTVSSQPDVRAGLVTALLEVAGAPDVPVAVGCSVPGDDRNVIGEEHTDRLASGATGQPADAVELLAGVDRETAIATIGQQTNLAAAVQRDPLVARRARELTVMGGSFAPFRTPDGEVRAAEADWNLVLDPAGAVASLAQGWRRLRYVPIDVTFRTVLTRGHVDRLREGDDLCRLLAELVDGWRARVHRSAPPEFAALLHDPLAVACVAECAYVHVERLPVTVMLDDRGLACTVVDPVEGRDAEVVRAVDAPGFADWLVETLLSS
jgi:inosine-uridine nucleoside N-ribohydrolase